MFIGLIEKMLRVSVSSFLKSKKRNTIKKIQAFDTSLIEIKYYFIHRCARRCIQLY